MECAENQPNGFMFRLGPLFLKTYYKLLLNEKHSVILIAEDENENMLGFASGTTDAKAHLDNLKRNRIRIGISMLPAIIKSPLILKNILDHEKFVSSKYGYIQFGVMSGPRSEYWAWRHNDKSNMSIPLLKTWLKIMYTMGAASVKAEVDINNKNLLTIYKFLGAKVVEHLKLNDGRNRVIIEYSNNKMIEQ
jgi:hypothetical protein